MHTISVGLMLLLAGAAVAHPRHDDAQDDAPPEGPFHRYILPRDASHLCDHTLSPRLADYYGDADDRSALREWIRTNGADGRGVRHGGKTAWSAQMHIHGSMSEGAGSMETQTFEALNAGVDVLWWSDHDHRMTYHHHVSTFSFDDWCEPWAVNEPWAPIMQFELSKYKSINRPLLNDEVFDPCAVNYFPLGFAAGAAEVTQEQAIEGTGSLRLSVTAVEEQTDFHDWTWQLFSDGRSSWRRSLASGVTLDIAVMPTDIGPDARPVIRIELSDHVFAVPAGGAGGADPYEFRQLALVYYLSNAPDAAPAIIGSELHVPLPFLRARWNEYTLDITADTRAAFENITGLDPFPWIEAADNSVHKIFFGIEARHGRTGTAYFDALRITDVVRGDDLFDLQRAMAERFEERVPEVHQHHGTELSLTAPQHLSQFGVDITLADYEQIARESPYWDDELGMIGDQTIYKEWLFAHLVSCAHARSGLVSYNHMWGGGLRTLTKEEMVDRLVANNAYGCDILEVGYRDRHSHELPDYLWVWDELQKRGMYLLGNGTSDLHGPAIGQWLTHGQNLVTWIYADSPDEPDLLDGLRRGRLYFGDPRLFPGAMTDIISDRGHRMGQIVLTDRDTASVTLELHGAANPDEIRVIIDGQLAHTHVASEFDPHLAVPDFAIATPRGSSVRFEVYRNNGQDKGFSNHLHFVRILPQAGVCAERAAFDVGNVYSLDMDGITLNDAAFSETCNATRLTIDVHTFRPDGSLGAEGALSLDLNGRGRPDSVRFAGMTGSWSETHDLMSFENLSGRGVLILEWGCPGDANGDNLVDFADLNAALLDWGKTGLACDLTGDGAYGFDDLNVVLSHYGESCEPRE